MRSKIISYSAPAKVILSGEHAVVYGRPCLVSAINLRLRFSVWEEDNTFKEKNVQFVADTVKDFLKNKKIKFKNKKFNYTISSQIPVKQRLGSSAALAVAGAAALIHLLIEKKLTLNLINDIGYQIEKYFHKNSSGVDTSVSCHGGLIYYRKEFEFLRNISSLNFPIPENIDNGLYLIDSGNPQETTGEMVEGVSNLFKKKPEYTESIFNDVEKVTKRMTASLIKKDINLFSKSILDNQIYLEMLGVVSPATKILLSNLLPFGIGKVTGGGGRKRGSGYILFFSNKIRELEEYLRKNKIKFIKFRHSSQGVRYE